jgi:ParB-like chromosome segregation protein Spo0J
LLLTEANVATKAVTRDKIPTPPRVEIIPIRALHPNPKNPRKHSRRQIKLLAALIRNIGFINPIIVDNTMMILAGHGRLEAAHLAGLTEVPVILFDHLTPEQKRAYAIADNRIAEQAGWDRELLSVELAELIELLPTKGLDVTLTGFEVGEIDLLLADVAAVPAVPKDELPPVPIKLVSRHGNLWQLGKHRLLCGDARRAADFTRLMNQTAAAAVICDPPYNLRARAIGGRGKKQHPDFAFASGEMLSAQFREFLSCTLSNGVNVSTDGAVQFVFMDWRHIVDLIEVASKLYDEMLNLAVWVKSNAGQGSFYRSQHELIGIFRVGHSQHRNNIELGRFGRNRSNVWSYTGQNTFAHGRLEALTAHPTVKPTNLVADAILDCTARGDIVLDQFAGSGTILLAAEKTGRIAYAMEYEPRYVDVAIQRWQSVTKLEATLVDDGRTFEEIASSDRIAFAVSRPSTRKARHRRRSNA